MPQKLAEPSGLNYTESEGFYTKRFLVPIGVTASKKILHLQSSFSKKQ